MEQDDILDYLYFGLVHEWEDANRKSKGKQPRISVATNNGQALHVDALDVGGIAAHLVINTAPGEEGNVFMLSIAGHWAPCTSQGLAFPGSEQRVFAVELGGRQYLRIEDPPLKRFETHDITAICEIGRREGPFEEVAKPGKPKRPR